MTNPSKDLLTLYSTGASGLMVYHHHRIPCLYQLPAASWCYRGASYRAPAGVHTRTGLHRPYVVLHGQQWLLLLSGPHLHTCGIEALRLAMLCAYVSTVLCCTTYGVLGACVGIS